MANHFVVFFGRRVEHKVSSRDALAELLAAYLDEIRELSIAYWSQKESEELKPKSARIVALCDNVPDLYLQLFENDTTTTRQLDVMMNRLSNVITGGSFQQADRKADQSVIAELESQLIALDVAIRLNKAKLRYPWL